MEVTFSDVFLFSWAAIATGFALKYHHEAMMAKFFVRKLITDEKVRAELVGAYEKFEKENQA